MDDDLGFYENVLRRIERDNSIVISKIHTKNACAKGDNFISEVKKVTVQGSKSNSEYCRSLVAKKFVQNPMITKFKFENLFRNECIIYKELLPVLKSCSKEMITPPICLYADEKILLFEDLHLDGYELKPRGYRFSLDECKIILGEISKLHAASLSLQEKEPNIVKKITKQLHCFINDEPNEALEECYNNHIDNAINFFQEDHLRSSSSKAISCLNKLREDNNYKNIFKILDKSTKVSVFNHGDLWGNNMFFKGNHLKLVDFQMVRFGSPAHDLSYFLWTNLDAKLRKSHRRELLLHYLEHLKFHCGENDVSDAVIRTLDIAWLENEMRLFSLHGLMTSFLFLPVFFMKPDDYMSEDEVTNDTYMNGISDGYKENVILCVLEYMESLETT